MSETRIIVIDDDPTGSQTVHSCLLLTRWGAATLVEALKDPSPLFFVLSNTRGMDAVRAADTTREICRNLRGALKALAEEGRVINPLVVSRSDSTLRGHYPVETDVIAQELGPFDAHFLVPAFFEGGRITREGVHYLMVDGKPVPVHQTEFARDSVFGYRHSFLPDYVEEKTRGRLRAAAVRRFGLDEIRGDPLPRLLALSGNTCCVVDAERQSDLDGFAVALREAARQGRRFLFRSGASLLTALAGLPPQPIAPARMGQYVRRGRAGVIVMGSHVPTSTKQLEHLLAHTDVAPVELDVNALDHGAEAVKAEVLKRVNAAHRQGRTAAIYTSRGERRFETQTRRLAFGELISACLMDVVRNLPAGLGFLISKGGITSNEVLSTGLVLRTARVLGQILPGCSVVRCPADHPRFPDLPVVIFPGNVGSVDALTQVVRVLARNSQATPAQDG